MCSAIDNEIKHINISLDKLVKGQERTDISLGKIEVHVATSVQRWKQEQRNWETQEKTNDIYREDIDKVDNRNKVFASLNGIAAIIAGIFGVSR